MMPQGEQEGRRPSTELLATRNTLTSRRPVSCALGLIRSRQGNGSLNLLRMRVSGATHSKERVTSG